MLRNAAISLLLIAAIVPVAAAADLNEDLLAAASKGDAESVERLLAKGADVNAKNSYGASALFFAADKGHHAVVKLLLEKKADVNAKDTFYKASPLDFAVSRRHKEVAKALIDAGATVTDDTLVGAAMAGDAEIVRAIIDKAKPKEEALTKALATTPAKHSAVSELLKKAGAKSPDSNTVAGDAKQWTAYVGTYRSVDAAQIQIQLEEGRLGIRFDVGPVVKLKSTDVAAFQTEDGKLKVTFRREGDKVSGLTVKREKNETDYRRFEAPKEPDPGTAAVEDLAGVVKTPLNWPSFRGPHASGVADGQFPPLSWDVEKNLNVRWKTPIPGLGHSCPVVWGDLVYVTTAVGSDGKAEFRPGLYGDVDSVNDSTEQSWRLYCLEKSTGKVVWERTACTGVPKAKRHLKGSHANPTPATDGTHIVASFGSEGLFCYDFAGKLLWKKNLGPLDSGWFFDPAYQWGFGSSPIIYKDLVIVQCDAGKDSFLAAYRVADGESVWRKSRIEIPSWGTPTIVESDDRVELVTNATKYARGYDPLTGTELWRLGRHSEITVPTPVFGEGLIFVTSGYRPVQPIYAVRPGATGDISLEEGQTSTEAVAWSLEKGGPYMTTPIVYRGHLYTCANNGIVTCYEAKTGKQLYKERLGGQGGFTASPVAAEGRIYFTGEESGVRVVRAGPEFELLSVNPLGDVCMATPAISDGMILVRTQHALIGIGRTIPSK